MLYFFSDQTFIIYISLNLWSNLYKWFRSSEPSSRVSALLNVRHLVTHVAHGSHRRWSCQPNIKGELGVWEIKEERLEPQGT